MSMNMNEMRETARQMTIAILLPVLKENAAVKWEDGDFAVLQEVEGQKIWTSVGITVKAWKDTKRSAAFDPYAAAAAWEEEKKIKAGVKAAKEAEKAAKVAAAKEKKEKA